MLTDTDLERLFAEWTTPAAGRALIRKIRAESPVRHLQYRMGGVRTRLISKKMGGKALYAESRTCEFPAIYLREHDPDTVELWPQPCKVDLKLQSGNGVTRVQHTPDLFLIEQGGFVIEEWRELPRLMKLAQDRPEHFYRDKDNQWHYVPVEEHFKELGIEYRLRCSDEHPRVHLSNLSILEDYALESTPPVPEEERQRILTLMGEHNRLAHLQLVVEHGFKADHVFQFVLDGTVYVDLYETPLRNAGELVIYRDRTVARADAVLNRDQSAALPGSALTLVSGTRFLFDGTLYEVVLLGKTQVTVREVKTGTTSLLDVALVEEMFQKQLVVAGTEQRVEKELDADVLFNENRLGEALDRLESLQNPDSAKVSKRTLSRWREKTKGLMTPQEQLDALVSRNPGNTTPRLPADVLALAEKVVKEFHNTAKNPTKQATYNVYTSLCADENVTPMSRAMFYKWIKRHESIVDREGKRKAYQKAPIPLTYDYEHPVHGVLPHEVCYCDHTILNIMLKGSVMPDLGKPTITLMLDGSLSKARGFYLSYRPASAVSVLMCLRDYVRRNGRLPRVLVLDNGREFHSQALLQFCSMFGITIRWRRASHPRDSTLVERMLGVTEQEIISQLDGNSLALKDPRMVSSTHHPDKHIRWTLPGLHGAFEYFLFDVHPNRIHPRFGISPVEYEKRLILECGAREHVIVRFDQTLKLLTSPHSGKATRAVDRKRGVEVDGMWYWHDKLALAKPGEPAEVRVELWRARAVYVCFRNNWYVAVARDGGKLEGRYRQEFELQQREETRARRTAAQKDKNTVENAKKRESLWDPERWDERIRDQLSEMYYLYERLGMAEALPEATNPQGGVVSLGLPKGTALDLIYAVEGEPGVYVAGDRVEDEKSSGAAETSASSEPKKGKRVAAKPAAPIPSPAAPPAASVPEPALEAPQDDDYF